MIVSGGRNVYPVEVEEALDEHPAVRKIPRRFERVAEPLRDDAGEVRRCAPSA